MEEINKISGLHNIGNTCYMNSVLQILIHNPEIRNFIESNEFSESIVQKIHEDFKKRNNNPNKEMIQEECQKTLFVQFYRLIEEMKKNKQVAPKIFKMILAMKNETYQGFAQNDSHELLNFIIDSFHEETKCNVSAITANFPPEYAQVYNIKNQFMTRLNSTANLNEKIKVINEYYDFEEKNQRDIVIYQRIAYWVNYIEKNFSMISQHMTGMYHSVIQCGKCNRKSNSFELFTTVSLEIPSINKNLTIFDCLNAFTKPEILDDDNKYNCGRCNMKTVSQKMVKFWDLPDTLFIQLKRFKHTENNILKISNQIEYPEILDISNYLSEYNKKQLVYKLTAVVHHYGNYGSGHYISNCLIDNEWFSFNDSCVSKIEKNNVQKEIMNDSTYIIVYSKMK